MKWGSKVYEELEALKKENKQLRGLLSQAKHNERQASESCRQHRLANKNKKRRLERREMQIKKMRDKLKQYESF